MQKAALTLLLTKLLKLSLGQKPKQQLLFESDLLEQKLETVDDCGL